MLKGRRACVRLLLGVYVLLLAALLACHYLLVDVSSQVLSSLANESAAVRYFLDRERSMSVVALVCACASVRRLRLEAARHDQSDAEWERTGLRLPRRFDSVPLRVLLLPTSVNCSNAAFTIIIKSRPEEIFQRIAIRDTWASTIRQHVVFALGMPRPSEESARLLSAIEVEAAQQGDILLVDFVDTYHNLSLKSLAILRWTADHCAESRSFVQGDSDALIFPQNVRQFVEHRRGATQTIFGYCWERSHVRRSGKWQVARRDYVPITYPVYCSGAAFVMTRDVPARLLAALDAAHPYIAIDDAFFTGVLAEAAFIRRQHAAGVRFDEDVEALSADCDCLRLLAVVEFKSPALLRAAWTRYRARMDRCVGLLA